MSRKLYCFIWLNLLTISISSSYAANLSISNSDAQIKEQISKIFQQNKIPGGAVIIYDNGKIRQIYIGTSNKQTKSPINANTIFELGSLTKTFTANLLAQQMLNNQMQPNQTILDDVKNKAIYSPSFKKMTLLELATHTSSLPYGIPNIRYNAQTTDNNISIYNKFLKTWQAGYPSGTKMLYSNVGYALLGNILAQSESKSLSALYSQNIFKPLGMGSTFTTVSPNLANYAQGYDGDGNPNRTPNEGIFGGSWAIKSTPTDMAKYLQAAIAGSPLQKAFQISQTGYFIFSNGEQQGLAWNVSPLDEISNAQLLKIKPLIPNSRTPEPVKAITAPNFNHNALIEKTGATDGFNSYIGLIPSQKIGIVIMTNHFSYDYRILKSTGRQILLNH